MLKIASPYHVVQKPHLGTESKGQKMRTWSDPELLHQSLVYNNKRSEATQGNDWRSETYAYNGILLGFKEGNSDTCHNMNEPWRHSQVWLCSHGSLRLVKFIERAWGLPSARSWGRGKGTVLSRIGLSSCLERWMASWRQTVQHRLPLNTYLQMLAMANCMLLSFTTI